MWIISAMALGFALGFAKPTPSLYDNCSTLKLVVAAIPMAQTSPRLSHDGRIYEILARQADCYRYLGGKQRLDAGRAGAIAHANVLHAEMER
jgi:hypothetical protein